jgi:hypothetical protein
MINKYLFYFFFIPYSKMEEDNNVANLSKMSINDMPTEMLVALGDNLSPSAMISLIHTNANYAKFFNDHYWEIKLAIDFSVGSNNILEKYVAEFFQELTEAYRLYFNQTPMFFDDSNIYYRKNLLKKINFLESRIYSPRFPVTILNLLKYLKENYKNILSASTSLNDFLSNAVYDIKDAVDSALIYVISVHNADVITQFYETDIFVNEANYDYDYIALGYQVSPDEIYQKNLLELRNMKLDYRDIIYAVKYIMEFFAQECPNCGYCLDNSTNHGLLVITPYSRTYNTTYENLDDYTNFLDYHREEMTYYSGINQSGTGEIWISGMASARFRTHFKYIIELLVENDSPCSHVTIFLWTLLFSFNETGILELAHSGTYSRLALETLLRQIGNGIILYRAGINLDNDLMTTMLSIQYDSLTWLSKYYPNFLNIYVSFYYDVNTNSLIGVDNMLPSVDIPRYWLGLPNNYQSKLDKLIVVVPDRITLSKMHLSKEEYDPYFESDDNNNTTNSSTNTNSTTSSNTNTTNNSTNVVTHYTSERNIPLRFYHIVEPNEQEKTMILKLKSVMPAISDSYYRSYYMFLVNKRDRPLSNIKNTPEK